MHAWLLAIAMTMTVTVASSAVAGQQERTAVVERGSFTVTLEVEGLFEEREPVILTFNPKSNVGPVTVAEAVPPGRVEKGDLLVRLEAPELERRIREQETAVFLLRTRLKRQVEEVRLTDETQALMLRSAERTLAQAEHAHEILREISLPEQLLYSETQVRDWDINSEEAEERFRLVVQMYEADDTIETAERMDMDIRRRSLDRRKASRSWTVARYEILRDQTLPRQIADSEFSIRKARHARDLLASSAENRGRLARLMLEKSATELRQEERKLEALQRDREGLTVVAPIRGFAVAGHYDGNWRSAGDLGAAMKARARVTPGQVLYSIVQPAPKRVRATVPEESLLQVRAEQKATLSPTATLSLSLPAEVTEIDPVVRNGRFVVWLTARVRHERLLPGSTCRVRLVLEDKPDALTVPVDAIRREGDRVFVDIFSNGEETPRHVEVGLTSQGRTEILAGVEAGEVVLAKGTRD